MRSRITLVAGLLVAAQIVLPAVPLALAADLFSSVNASASTVVAASVYYVDCAPGLSGDGSAASPWTNLTQVNGHGEFQPGDQILLKRGTRCSGFLRPLGSGAPGAPIVLGAYGEGVTPLLNGDATPSGHSTIQLTNVHDWTVQDLHVTNVAAWATKGYRSAVLLQDNHAGRLGGMTVQRMQIDRVMSNPTYVGPSEAREWGGISVVTNGIKNEGFDGLRIVNNRLTDVGRTGIAVFNHAWPRSADRGVRVSGNTVTKSRGDGIIVFGSRGARIDHNVSAGAASFWPCPQCATQDNPQWANAGIWTIKSDGVRIDHNEAYGTHAKGGDGEGFDIDIDTTRVVFEYNYSHDNEAGSILLCGSSGAVVRFNIFEDDLRSSIVFIGSHPATGTQIYNNTIYSSKKSGAGVVRYFNGARGSKIRFYNNLVYGYGTGRFTWPVRPWTKANTIVGPRRVGQPADARTSRRDPGLVSPGSGGVGFSSLRGYKRTKAFSSPAGAVIPSSVSRDFFGKKINPKRPPRGAAG